MLCTNTIFYANDKTSAKVNPWGLYEDKWKLWSCCSCFRKNHVAPMEQSAKSDSSIVPVKIVEENEEIAQTKLDTPTQQVPPRSSGSESSGYFTPPPEHHLKEQPLERSASEETFEGNHTGQEDEPDFQVIDSEASENQEPAFVRQISISSGGATDTEQPPNENNCDVKSDPPQSPLNDFNFDENSRIITEPRSKSRIEIHRKSSLPEIDRKNINSAPPLNDIVNINIVNIVPYPEMVQVSTITTTLPGSIVSNEHSPEKKSDDSETSRRLSRRSLNSRGKRHSQSQPPEIRPYSRPKEALLLGLNQMDSCEWELTIQGLNCLIRLARNHPEILEPYMHTICVTLAKNIRNLRSQVARVACHAASEIFATCRKGLDMELEELAGPLLQRTADTNKFLRSDANAALDVMCLNLSIPRVVAVITNKGFTHQNCVVRAAATRLLSDIAARLGHERIYQLPKDTRDKFFIVGANGLTEGSLDTRKYAKSLMGTLMENYSFQKVLKEVVPQHIIRHITKSLNSLKC